MLNTLIFFSLAFSQFSKAEATCINTFRVPINSIPLKLDPHLGNEFDLNAVAFQVYEGLTSFSGGTTPKPNLASWEIDYKKSIITFTLFGAEFSDKSPVTSKDVVKSILRSEKMGNAFSDVLQDFKNCTTINNCTGVKILNDQVVSFAIKNNAFELFLKKAAGMEGFIVKEEGDKLLGSAPFVIQSKSHHNIILKRWQNNANKNLFDCIQLKLTSTDKASVAFKAGEIDIINNGQFKVDSDIVGTELPVEYIGTSYIGLNFRRPYIKELAFRKALSLAINRKTLATSYGIKPVGSFITFGLLGYESMDTEYEPLAAREMIKRLNLVGHEFVLLVSDKYKGNAEMRKCLMDSFEILGLKLKLEYLPFTKMLKIFRENRADGILKTDSPQNYDPTTMFIGMETGSNSNSSGYSDKRLDELVNRAKTTLDVNERLKLLHQLNVFISQELPILAIGYSPLKRWVRSGILIPNLLAQRMSIWTTDYTDFEIIQKR